jgi:hypothetical protein
MVRRAYRQRSLIEVLLPDADKLWDPTLRRIDTLLDDDGLVDRVEEALAQRHPQSRGRGRLRTPAAVVLRMLILKHLHDWSFDECEREVRGSLVYRAFCRIDGERVPDAVADDGFASRTKLNGMERTARWRRRGAESVCDSCRSLQRVCRATRRHRSFRPIVIVSYDRSTGMPSSRPKIE